MDVRSGSGASEGQSSTRRSPTAPPFPLLRPLLFSPATAFPPPGLPRHCVPSSWSPPPLRPHLLLSPTAASPGLAHSPYNLSCPTLSTSSRPPPVPHPAPRPPPTLAPPAPPRCALLARVPARTPPKRIGRAEGEKGAGGAAAKPLLAHIPLCQCRRPLGQRRRCRRCRCNHHYHHRHRHRATAGPRIPCCQCLPSRGHRSAFLATPTTTIRPVRGPPRDRLQSQLQCRWSPPRQVMVGKKT